MSKFIGRQDELRRLLELTNKKSASFVVIKGRRRIGKSRLVKELGKSFDHFYSFIGLAPDKLTTTKHQLDEFSRQISREFKTAPAHYNDWSDSFWAIGEKVRTGKTLLLFDEISWMGSEEPTFLAKIKNLWDQYLKENDQLIFVICGSASAWIEKNILSSTGFVGRISLTLTLNELPLTDCRKFWPKNISAYEIFKVLSVTGGIPKYLEEINPKLSAEENIRKLCFMKGGFLAAEFEQIFSDIFLRKSEFYKQIIVALSSGAKDQSEICEAINIERYGRISDYLWELELAGFVTRDHTWKIKSAQDSELSRYRLSDNYCRFYLKYIEKNLSKVNRNMFSFKSLTSLPEWHTIMGFQFENLILNNRRLLSQFLKINPEEIVCENPFFQRKTSRTAGCQIDYMIQTKFGSLYVCEIKFHKTAVDSTVIQEVQKKIDMMKYPKGFSCRAVLIHVNGVTQDVIDSDYFSEIIDAGKMLEEQYQ
jgi:AAA+ ATPase superfamily predicted ATPase